LRFNRILSVVGPTVTVIGAGPAGSCAAIAAALAGSRVELYDKSRFPRHKVCGEFLSPGIVPELQRLGVWDRFAACRPASIRRFALYFGTKRIDAPLLDEAFGLSRYRLDEMLLERAGEVGVPLIRSRPESSAGPVVIAHGRAAPKAGIRGRRLFGFKAHFEGPASDAIELYFSREVYVGVSAVEGGRTNVCGLAPERRLQGFHFDFDEIVHSIPALKERLAPLQRSMDWLATGPLVFRNVLRREMRGNTYAAGDALSFVDPFTGSGILAAVMTGTMAGECAAKGIASREYLRMCRARLAAPFHAASLFRLVLRLGWADRVGSLAPPQLLFRLTRPALATK
jgi:hypothetical protein